MDWNAKDEKQISTNLSKKPASIACSSSFVGSVKPAFRDALDSLSFLLQHRTEDPEEDDGMVPTRMPNFQERCDSPSFQKWYSCVLSPIGRCFYLSYLLWNRFPFH
ncbi:hypothetical protein KP509_28G057100 [Ceratopteris richardii]|uniref:Uncharacterized protein n=1 Tax=Ceratopteris richardii TaxID=49495 RepID=A0A8T2RCD5_CERRI|nr:hypothetical protein KP509_28G057100 [Ceratopteris richardii]